MFIIGAHRINHGGFDGEIFVDKSKTASHCEDMGPTGMGPMHIMRIDPKGI